MLSGIRLISSAAASSVRAGGCTPKLACGPAGQPNPVGFIRFLSGASRRNAYIPAQKICMRLADLRNTLQLGPLIIGIRVTIAPSFHDCFLDTQIMAMRYQTAQQPWSFGNIALNWIINHDAVDKEAIRFSNYVTERANEAGTPPGIPEKFLDTANQLIGGGINLLVLGTGVKCYLEEDPNAPGNIAIASYLDGTNKYYLQPQVGDNKIIGKTGDPQYVFGFVNPQPLPSLS